MNANSTEQTALDIISEVVEDLAFADSSIYMYIYCFT